MYTPRPASVALCAAALAVSSATAAAPPEHLWSQHFGTAGASTRGYAVAVDPSGNVLVTGSFNGTVSFGGDPLEAQGTDIVLAKYSAAGAHLWSRSFGGTAAEQAYSLAIDAAGNAFITGYFQGTANFGGADRVSYGISDMFIAKYDPSGNHVWSTSLGTPDADVGYAVATDAAGSAVVTGYVHGQVPSDIMIAKYNTIGTLVWFKAIGSTGYDEGLGAAVDGAGNVLVTGSFTGTVDFGGGNLSTPGDDWDVFVVKYTSTGGHLWSRRFGDVDLDAGLAIVTDPSDNVLVTGYFLGEVNFGGTPLTSLGVDVDVFLAKYDPSGNHVWSRRLGGMSYESGYGLAVDGSSNVFLAGYFADTANFGGADLVSGGNIDIFFAEYRADGTHVSSQCFGGTAADAAQSIAVDDSGHRYLTGYFAGSVDFGGTALTSTGTPDMFLVKYGTVASAAGSNPPFDTLSLSAAPNPFNPSTMLHYRVPSAGHVQIAIFDVRGRLVETLVDEMAASGAHTIRWQGRDRTGRPAASGVYFARIAHAGMTRTHKLVLLK